jgi:uncharacterized protein YutE (UPF0331/DUF86 family)
MTTRGEGRNRSEIPDLDARILALDEELEERELPDRTLLFNVEAYAWAILQRLRAEIFERRFEMPKSDGEVFSILQKHELLDLVESRRLKQFCESRNLASRDLAKIDVSGIREMADDREWIREIVIRLKA